MRRKYDWEAWFGRRRTVLARGVHYGCSQSAMSQMVRNAASRRGLRVRLADTGTAIVVDVIGTVGGGDEVLPADTPASSC